MTHPVLRISATLALLLAVAAWLLPWSVYPDDLTSRTQAWDLARRRPGPVLALAVTTAVVVVAAGLAWLGRRGRRAGTVTAVVLAVATVVAVALVATLDLGSVTWSGRAPDGTDTGGGARIGRGAGMWLVAAAPVVATVGRLVALVSDPTARTPAPARPPAG